MHSDFLIENYLCKLPGVILRISALINNFYLHITTTATTSPFFIYITLLRMVCYNNNNQFYLSTSE